MKNILLSGVTTLGLLIISNSVSMAQVLIQDQFTDNGTGTSHDGAPTIQGRTPDTVNSGSTWLGSSGGVRLIGTDGTGANAYGMGNYYYNQGGAAIALPSANQATGTLTLSFNIENLPSANAFNGQYFGFSSATGLGNSDTSSQSNLFPDGSAWVNLANTGGGSLTLTLSDGSSTTIAASNATGAFNNISLTYDLDSIFGNVSVAVNGTTVLTGSASGLADYAAYYSNYANQEQNSNPTMITNFTVSELQAVPEPSTNAMLLLGIGAFWAFRRSSRNPQI